jgi:hypothetical protein
MSLARARQYKEGWLSSNPGKTAQYSTTYARLHHDRKLRTYAEQRAKPENRARQRKRTLEHSTSTRAWLAEIKIAAGCADCGYNAHAVALDFDHLPGTVKSFDVARSTWRARHLVEAEIGKCEVVCANCHRIRSYSRLMEKLRNATS